MATPVDELDTIVREVLGGRASDVLLERMRATLEKGAGSPETLCEACTRLERMAALFLGKSEAGALKTRFEQWRQRSGQAPPD
jgi:hypothetical protein